MARIPDGLLVECNVMKDSNQRSRVGYARQRNDTNQNRKEVIVTANAGIITTDLTPNLTCNKVSQT